MSVVLDRELAVDHDLVTVAPDRGRDELDLGKALGVEELRRAEVRLEVLVLHEERVGVDRAGQARVSVVAHVEQRVQLLEATAEGGHGHVLDGEAGGRMCRIEPPGAGRYRQRRGGWECGCHF